MSAVAFDRTTEQRLASLRIANEIRVYRSQLKRDIADGTVSVLNVLEAPHRMTATMRLYDLLLAVPGIGRWRANKILQVTRTSPSKTLAGLTDRQRGEVAAAVRERMRGHD